MVERPLREISLDRKNNKVVCEYENKFIDFDLSKGKLRKPEVPETPDMLYIDKDRKELWFVEFKSSSEKNLDKEKFKLKRKLLSGLTIFYELFCDEACSYKGFEKFYYVVYDKKSRFESYEDELMAFFDENRSVEFSLEDMKPKFVKDVFTESCEEFKRLFENRFNIKFVKGR